MMFDGLGLADPVTSHFDASGKRPGYPPLPGHEKALPAAWAAARLQQPGPAKPDDYLSNPAPLIEQTDGAEFQEQVAWARAAPRCPDISRAAATPRCADDAAPVHASNLLHSLDRTRMRIPPDPETAYKQYCGSDVPKEVKAARAANPSP